MFQRRFLSKIVYPNISITTNAWKKFDDIIKNKEISQSNHSDSLKGFLFSAKSGGCNGFNYNLSTLTEKQYSKIINNKTVIPTTVIKNNNIGVIIDPIAEPILIGTTIDYIKADYTKNNYESKFIFTPDSSHASSCGCGKSFTVKD